MSIEQWNTLAHVYNHCATEGLIDEEGNFLEEPSTQELAGGCGFFKEEIPEAIYEEEEEDE